MWIIFYFISIVSFASCLPTVESIQAPASYFSCSIDADCVVYTDACRSCGSNVIAVNLKFSEEFKNLDIKARVANKCVIACEACGTSHIKVKCLKNQCSISK